ncbi:cytochrome C [Echinicola jeungdonensis]|uniref:C-type cytochrome n=1 Tax=Echinicola jeungdonensis TaxID=709343 RepID=A0ABV5J3C4_9BACT|nr:cytochrome C [Echinicola jeungdonensis]MDN3669586.1 cytochrome C [Echinicola jeungdonensis]
MKNVLKFLMYAMVIIAVIVIGALAYIQWGFPKVEEAPEMVVEGSPELISRGEYLAHHVMLCMDCHAERDFSLYAGPPIPETLGAGGERFDRSMGFPGVFFSANITPAGIGDYTDGELFRLITTGVKNDGEPIFPVMPYQNYGRMDEEDIKAVIAYIRTLKPVQKEHPKSEVDFPVNFILRTMPSPADPQTRPEEKDIIKYGEYLVNAAACGDCHTKFEKGEFTGPFLAGGREFMFPNGTVIRTPNLTKDKTGLGNWSKQQFVARFKSYDPATYKPNKINQGEFQTIMPWIMYAGMKESDLGAIYDYLMSLEPVENEVLRVSFAE